MRYTDLTVHVHGTLICTIGEVKGPGVFYEAIRSFGGFGVIACIGQRCGGAVDRVIYLFKCSCEPPESSWVWGGYTASKKYNRI